MSESPPKAHVYMYKEKPFKTEEVERLWDSIDEDRVTYVAPYLPKAGEVYVYAWKSPRAQGNWRFDQYKWRNNGTHKLPKHDPKFVKYYHILTFSGGFSTKDFSRTAFMRLNDDKNYVIIQYTGDETLSTMFSEEPIGKAPAGGSALPSAEENYSSGSSHPESSSTSPHSDKSYSPVLNLPGRIFSSALNVDKSSAAPSLPKLISPKSYKKNKKSSPAVTPSQRIPPNQETWDRGTDHSVKTAVPVMAESSKLESQQVLEQVTAEVNTKHRKLFQHKHRRLTKQTVGDIYHLAHELKQFVWKIEIFPSFVCVVGLDEVFHEFDKVLTLQSLSPQLLLYDNVYRVNEYSISTVMFRHLLYKNSPAVPLAFLIHEPDAIKCHDTLLSLLASEIPSLKEANIPVVINREPAILDAFEKHLPNLFLLYSWSAVRKDAKNWLSSLGVDKKELALFLKDLTELLSARTDEIFTAILIHKHKKWNAHCYRYFRNHLREDIKSHAVRWVIDSFQVFSSYTGVSSNIPPIVRKFMKDLENWTEGTLTGTILALYHFHTILLANMKLGLCGESTDFVVEDQYYGAKMEEEDVYFSEDSLLIKAEEILDHVNKQLGLKKGKSRKKEMNTDSYVEQVTLEADVPLSEDQTHQSTIQGSGPQGCANNSPKDNGDESSGKELGAAESLNSGGISQNLELACSEEEGSKHETYCKMPDEDCVDLNTASSGSGSQYNVTCCATRSTVVNIVDAGGEKHVVSLLPDENCDCRMDKPCQHIVVAKSHLETKKQSSTRNEGNVPVKRKLDEEESPSDSPKKFVSLVTGKNVAMAMKPEFAGETIMVDVLRS